MHELVHQHFQLRTLVVLGLSVLAFGAGFMHAKGRQASLGGPTVTYTEVPATTVTCSSPTWEHTFKRDSDGQTFVVQVTEEEYTTWLRKSMTEPGTLPPKFDGYSWVQSVGGKQNCTSATTTLASGEFYTVREATATQTPLYVYKEGNKTTTSSTKP